MKKLLILLMIIPTISMARTNTEIKRLVTVQFDDYMDQIEYGTRYQVCSVKLVRLQSGMLQINTNHLKGSAIIAKKRQCDDGNNMPIALDIYDGEDLVIHSLGPAFKLK